MNTEPVRPRSMLPTAAERLCREFESLLEAARARSGRALDAIAWRAGQPWTPDADVIESPDRVVVLLDVPGARAESLDVRLAGTTLHVEGKRPWPTDEVAGEVRLQERRCGEFSRTIDLPAPVDPDSVEAALSDGVLRIVIRKTEQARARRVMVRSAETEPPTASEATPEGQG